MLGTDPAEPDTDGDGMDDGWEHTYAGFDPLVPNDATLDTDGDGLTDGEECEMGTNPLVTDTDGDGMNDGTEVLQDSDPGDSTDGGQAGSRMKVFFYFGDHSDSHSEKYRLHVEPDPDSGQGTPPRSYAVKNAHYGRCETKKVLLKRGWRYDVRLSHAGTNLAKADYDYTLRLSNDVAAVLLDDPQHLFCVDDTSSRFAAKGKVAALYVLDGPKVVPDYDRDGRIDSTDEAVYDARQTTFMFWINDDNDTGDINDSGHDRPGSGANGQNGKVDGRGDLLDFTPVLLDISKVFPIGTPDHVKSRVSLRLQSSVVNAVWTSLSASAAGSFHRTADSGATFGPNLSQNAHEATVTNLAGGVKLPNGFVSLMGSNGGKGVVMIEGRTSGSSMRLQGFIDGSQTPSFEGSLAIEISSVEDMYRYVTLRGAENSNNFTVQLPGMPPNLMEGSKDLDVFFTHGFNVTESDAHAWGSEIFKRLWQSGSNARFWMFTWSGDYNWLGNTFNGLHYQQDVYQALKTGATLKAFVESAQVDSSKRILMTQSLGNMVACEALRQGLSVGKYFMFNAAIASEAIDGTLQNANSTIKAKYVPSDWSDYDSLSWAANWHKWFINDTTDSRGKMGWPNYFSSALANATTAYNYYSTGDLVFMEEDTVPGVVTGVFHWPTLNLTWPFIQWEITTEANCWQKQETHKGVEPIAGTLLGGWGFNCWYENVGGEPVQMYYTAAQANAMAANGSITNSPVFSHSGTPLNNRNATQDDIWLSLAKYIPAVSSPVGGINLGAASMPSYNLNDAQYRHDWGRNSDVYGQNWLHSDMKDMAYFYVCPLYDDLRMKGNLK